MPDTESTMPLSESQPAPPEHGAAEPGTESAAAPTAAETIPATEELLRAAELKAAEHHDAWLRARAETENVRKRAQEDIAKAAKFAVDRFAQSMLPVKDSLEATLAAESATLESLREGVEVTLKQLASGLTNAGVTEVNPMGEKFDPHRHQAISTVEADGETNRVVTVLQKGYLLHDRVLRPALVVVSRARDSSGPG